MDQGMFEICLWMLLIVATASDLHSSRIPNGLTFSMMGAGVAGHGFQDGWNGLLHSVEGLTLGLVLLLCFYVTGGMGAGDVKLAAAIGSLVGPHELLLAMFLTALCGGLCALIVMVGNWGVRGTLRWGIEHMRSMMLTQQVVVPIVHSRPRLSLRYAPVMAIGTVIAQLVQRGHWSL